MGTTHLIDELCNAQIDDQACQTEGLLPREAMHVAHQLDHRFQCNEHRFVEVFMEAKCDPPGGSVRPRCRHPLVGTSGADAPTQINPSTHPLIQVRRVVEAVLLNRQQGPRNTT